MPDLDSPLDRLTAICLALPEAACETHGNHASFTVPTSAARSKKFAYYLDDHHGDGKVALSVRLPRGANAALVDEDPRRFYLPAYMAHHGWVALRLDLGAIDWDEVEELVADSYRLQAPKRLAALVPSSSGEHEHADRTR
jgi:phosphoribosylglycinamide formyltransferase-1